MRLVNSHAGVIAGRLTKLLLLHAGVSPATAETPLPDPDTTTLKTAVFCRRVSGMTRQQSDRDFQARIPQPSER